MDQEEEREDSKATGIHRMTAGEEERASVRHPKKGRIFSPNKGNNNCTFVKIKRVWRIRR